MRKVRRTWQSSVKGANLRKVHVLPPNAAIGDGIGKTTGFARECKKCHHRESPRKGSAGEISKLPFRHRLAAAERSARERSSFSALELQRRLGHGREGRHGKPGTSRARSKRASADGIRTGEGFFAVGILGKGKGRDAGADSLTKDESSRQGRRRRGRRAETRQEKRTEKTDHVKMTVIPGMRPSAADGRAEVPNGGDSSLASGETEAYIRSPDRPEGRTGRVAGGTTAERSVHGCA